MNDTTAEPDRDRNHSPLLQALAVTAGFGSLVTGLIKAKDSADRLDHADVIVSSITVLLFAFRWRRDRKR